MCKKFNPIVAHLKTYLLTFGKDHRTYELSLAILNEEIEHEAWFSEFLGEGPSGHFRRGAPGESPYTSRFLVVPQSHNGK
jgi:hypothetical protein